MEIPREIEVVIHDAIANPHEREWTLQGFGMLRAYLDESRTWRLHVWDSRYRTGRVSTIHDHPWDFESRVLSGALVNRRYLVKPYSEETAPSDQRPTHWENRILCGEDAQVDHTRARVPVMLKMQPLELCVGRPGMPDFVRFQVSDYSQRAAEVHDTEYLDGTVSIVRRSFSREDRDHALVYVPDFSEWVDATPRPASEDEIANIITSAVERWRAQD